MVPTATGCRRSTQVLRRRLYEAAQDSSFGKRWPGRLGETYNVGGWNEKPNIDIVNTVCALLDELAPRADGASYRSQISYVTDRPGHDRRYAIDARKLERELGWKPAETFETGIRKTVQWYLAHPDWVRNVQSGAYRDWVQTQYAA